jgi:hypothetical protein
MHKISKTLIHIWISVVSLGAFVFSWVLLVHSPKPAPLIQTQSNDTSASQVSSINTTSLQPIQSLSDYLKAGSRTVQVPQSNITANTTRPRLRTRGS